ncbi:MAG: IclR family transcriptional regulator [Pseudomonadota bacterium]
MNKQMKSDGTVGKALQVLDLVAELGRPVRFSELLELSEFPKASLYRFLQTLTNQGMLAYDPVGQTYTPGLRLVRLAHAAWRSTSLAPIARPFIDKLAQETGETVHLAQMDGGQVLYVDKRNAAAPVEMFSSAGKIGPGYCTGVGKAIMAHLPLADQDRAISQQAFLRYTDSTLTTARALRADLEDVRAAGVAFDREEHEPGIICIAAPIMSGNRAIGGLSVTSTTQRHSLQTLENFKPLVLAASQDISAAAANWQFPS